MLRRTLNNSADVIDSRDVIVRIEELEDDENRDESDNEELAALKALNEEGKNVSPDWSYGATLVRDDYFTEYAQQLVEDIGDMPRGVPHYIVIDWDATADNIQTDYSSVDFDGVTYWVR